VRHKVLVQCKHQGHNSCITLFFKIGSELPVRPHIYKNLMSRGIDRCESSRFVVIVQLEVNHSKLRSPTNEPRTRRTRRATGTTVGGTFDLLVMTAPPRKPDWSSDQRFVGGSRMENSSLIYSSELIQGRPQLQRLMCTALTADTALDFRFCGGTFI